MAIRCQVGGRKRHRPDTWHTIGAQRVTRAAEPRAVVRDRLQSCACRVA